VSYRDYYPGLPNPGPFVDFSPVIRRRDTPSQTQHQELLVYESTVPGYEGWDWQNPIWWASRSGPWELTPDYTALPTYYGDTPASIARNILSGQGQLWT
jgi:hypothetical protein